MESLAAGRRVLNLFSYLGGFSLYAARGGAASVCSVDISGPALAAAERNFALNRNDPAVAACPHETAQADVFCWLREAAARRFDLIVLDPPALAKRQSERAAALRAYSRLLAGAMERLNTNGMLVAASCSAHVATGDFFNLAREAARQTGRGCEEWRTTGHAPDHPVSATFPEGGVLQVHLSQVSIGGTEEGGAGRRVADQDGGSLVPPRNYEMSRLSLFDKHLQRNLLLLTVGRKYYLITFDDDIPTDPRPHQPSAPSRRAGLDAFHHPRSGRRGRRLDPPLREYRGNFPQHAELCDRRRGYPAAARLVFAVEPPALADSSWRAVCLYLGVFVVGMAVRIDGTYSGGALPRLAWRWTPPRGADLGISPSPDRLRPPRSRSRPLTLRLISALIISAWSGA